MKKKGLKDRFDRITPNIYVHQDAPDNRGNGRRFSGIPENDLWRLYRLKG